jgi:DNA-binding response OmpR family regulator
MKRVLIVEDDAAIRALLTDVLLTEGYAVREAATGAEALRDLEHERPEAIVLDLMLPDMDGRQVARSCHEQTSGTPIPILLMSALPELWRVAEQLRRCGVLGFMSKPFDVDIFLTAVDRLTAPPPAPAAHTRPPAARMVPRLLTAYS